LHHVIIPLASELLLGAGNRHRQTVSLPTTTRSPHRLKREKGEKNVVSPFFHVILLQRAEQKTLVSALFEGSINRAVNNKVQKGFQKHMVEG